MAENTRGTSTQRRQDRARPVGVNDVLRVILELFTLFTLGYWGYLAWPFPWPGAAFMIGAPLFAIIVWALFRAPKALVPVDIVGRGIVEIGVMGSAAIAWAMLGQPLIAAVFSVVAFVSGAIHLRKEARADNAG